MATYKPIQSVTLTNSTSTSVTFSGLDQSYTDLYIVMNIKEGSTSTTGNVDVYMQFNGDTGTNYSMSQLYSSGSTPTANRSSGATYIYAGSMPPNLNEFSCTRIDLNGYSNATTWKTCLIKTGLASSLVAFRASQWRNTSAVTSLKIYPEGSYTFAAGSTFSLYGIKAGTPQALGGDLVTTDGNYWYHTFRSTQTFTPLKPLTVDYLVVAGGGGGAGVASGGSYGAPGGGAGGLRSTVTATGGGGSLESALSLTGQAYTVTVGAGGARSEKGSNSTLHTITSEGGGLAPAGSGGSGAGAFSFGTLTPGTGATNQGFAGAAAAGNTSPGGGGGAGGAGSSARTGGAGVTTSISGTSTAYAGGGAGGWGGTATAGGGAGGAANTNANGTAGTANTGGGGGGSSVNGGDTLGAPGGSGIVIVRYPV